MKKLHSDVFILAALIVVQLFFTPGVSAHDVQKVALNAEQCARLTAHRPGADVAYSPGRDVRGKAVVPADLSDRAGLPKVDELVIPLDLNVAERLGLTLGAGLEAIANLGEITYQDGQLYLNGRALGQDDQASLAKACNAASSKPD